MGETTATFDGVVAVYASRTMNDSGRPAPTDSVAVRRDTAGQNVDDAAAFYAHLYDAHQITLTPTREAFSYRVRAVGDAVMTLRSSVVTGHRWGRIEPNGRYVLAWTQRGPLTIDAGIDTEQLIQPGSAVMFPTGRPFTVDVTAGTVLHTIDITAAFLERIHHTDTDQTTNRPRPLEFSRTPEPAALGALQQHLAEAAPELLDPSTPAPRRAFLTRSVCRAILASFVQPVDGQAPHGADAVGRALQFINDHSAEPITGTDIAAAAGRSARGLQQAFAKANLPTPMVALRQARLRAVRAALQDAEPGSVTIAQIATAAGFGHIGRFSSYYHHEYAELPSTTLNTRRKAARSTSS